MENILNRYKLKLGLDEDKQSFSEIHSNKMTAFYYMCNTTVNLDKDLTKVIDSIEELENLHKKSGLMFKMNTCTEENAKYVSLFREIDTATDYLKQQFLYLKENIIKKDKFNNFLFWKYNLYIMNNIKLNHKILEQLGLKTLKNEEKLYWRTSVCNMQDEVLSLITSLLNICKLELNFVEEYFPNRWNEDTSDSSISDFQSIKHEQDKKSTDQNKHKNIWTSVMDFFSGGTSLSHL